MTDVLQMNTLPGNRQLRMQVPQINAKGSMNQRCRSCHRSMLDEDIACVVLYAADGTVESPGVWMHLEPCAQQRYEIMLATDMRRHNVEFHSGTQKEFIAFVQTHEFDTVVMNYAYSRGKAVRYLWSRIPNMTLEMVVMTTTGSAK